jgi:hypothetical protein
MTSPVEISEIKFVMKMRTAISIFSVFSLESAYYVKIMSPDIKYIIYNEQHSHIKNKS